MTNFRPPRDARPPRPLLARLHDAALRVCRINSFHEKAGLSQACFSFEEGWYFYVRASGFKAYTI
jgi:hypothetical protein